jgi:hypothetical protein
MVEFRLDESEKIELMISERRGKMRKIIFMMSFAIFLYYSGTVYALVGTTDRVPAATLLVPLFETGIDVETDPQDSLLVVTNVCSARKFHFHVWDRDGNPTDIQGNIDLNSLASWTAAMRDLINLASISDRTQLTEGMYYRGFVTIDVVTSDTAKNPTEAGYPFGNGNCLEGFIYFTRLTEGSANGLAMVPLEHVGSGLNATLQDFYQSGDGREEIDAHALNCASLLAIEEECVNDSDQSLDRIHSRVFIEPGLNGESRIIVFTWNPSTVGGPSLFCDSDTCDSTYTYRRYDEDSNLEENTSIRFDRVVNIIEVSGSENGWVSIWNIAQPTSLNPGFQVYAFSFNSAKPTSISANWDAIFESYIIY